MITFNSFYLTDLRVEHMTNALGIENPLPRFSWKLNSSNKNVVQTAYRIRITESEQNKAVIDTGFVDSAQSVEVTVNNFHPEPMTEYRVYVTVWDNYNKTASLTSHFETGRMGIPFSGKWVEPEQEPTPSTMETPRDGEHAAEDGYVNGTRDFHQFRPAQYIRIPFTSKKPVKKARIYASARGLYRLSVNGTLPDNREFAPENSAYQKVHFYQTYDVTSLLVPGENVI
jgi:alpha-L-rhamnosidase